MILSVNILCGGFWKLKEGWRCQGFPRVVCSLLGSSKLMYARSDKVFWAWGWNSLQTQRTFPQILKSYCWCILWCGKSPIVDLPIISHKKKYLDFLSDIVDGKWVCRWFFYVFFYEKESLLIFDFISVTVAKKGWFLAHAL